MEIGELVRVVEYEPVEEVKEELAEVVDESELESANS